MDSFIEYMIRQKKSAAAKLKTALIVLGAIVISFIITLIFLMFLPIAISLMPLCIAGIMYGAYRIIASFNIEYEYILTNGELDVDKITNKKRRKRLITVHCKTFTHFGKLTDSSYQNLKDSDFARVIDASAHSDNYETYYAVFFKNGQRVKLIFNPVQKMIDIFKIYAPRVVI